MDILRKKFFLLTVFLLVNQYSFGMKRCPIIPGCAFLPDSEEIIDSSQYDFDRSSPSLEKMHASFQNNHQQEVLTDLSSDEEIIGSDDSDDESCYDYFIGRGGFEAIDLFHKILSDIEKYNRSMFLIEDERVRDLYMRTIDLLLVEGYFGRKSYVYFDEQQLQNFCANFLNHKQIIFDQSARFALEKSFFESLNQLADCTNCFASKNTEQARNMVLLIEEFKREPKGVVFEISNILEDIRVFNFAALRVDNEALHNLYCAVTNFLQSDDSPVFKSCLSFTKKTAASARYNWENSYHSNQSKHSVRAEFKVKLIDALERLIKIFKYPLFEDVDQAACLLKMTEKTRTQIIAQFCR